jgi:transcriptional regulator with XRE-family HTH domain
VIKDISLRAARINRNMTIEDAAAKVGMSVRQLYRLEAGETIPKWDIVVKLAEVYGYAPTDLRIERKEGEPK